MSVTTFSGGAIWCLRGKGWHGVLCRLKAVWSMPERFKVVCIPCKAQYKCSAFSALQAPYSQPNRDPRWKIFTIFPQQLTFAGLKAENWQHLLHIRHSHKKVSRWPTEPLSTVSLEWNVSPMATDNRMRGSALGHGVIALTLAFFVFN